MKSQEGMHLVVVNRGSQLRGYRTLYLSPIQVFTIILLVCTALGWLFFSTIRYWSLNQDYQILRARLERSQILLRHTQYLEKHLENLNTTIQDLNQQLDAMSEHAHKLGYDKWIDRLKQIPSEPESSTSQNPTSYSLLEDEDVIQGSVESLYQIYQLIGIISQYCEELQEKIPYVSQWLGDMQKVWDLLPIRKPTQGYISSRYGRRANPLGPKMGGHTLTFHYGLDFAAPRGTPVYATASGSVVFSGAKGAYGRMILLQHSQSLLTRYAHLQQIYVKPGDRVKAGQVIGTVGSTGRSTGDHLHYELIVGKQSVNPETWLTVQGLQSHLAFVHKALSYLF